jgi:predicted DNA-binding transcriptional regulator AlpA
MESTAAMLSPDAIVNGEAAYKSAKTAIFTGLSPFTLADQRAKGRGPDYIRVGHRTVLYTASAIKAWMDARTVRPSRKVAASR